MAKLIIPRSVGGIDPDITPQGLAQPIKMGIQVKAEPIKPKLTIPVSVGGTAQQRGLGRVEQGVSGGYQAVTDPSGNVPTWEGIRDIFTGGLRETPQSRDLPETTPISAAKHTDGSLKAVQSIAGSLLAADDEGRKTSMRSLIPGIDIFYH